MREKITWLKEQEKVWKVLEVLVYIFLFYKVFVNIILVPETLYEVPRRYVLYKGICWFLLIILIERRVKLYRFPFVVTIIAYSLYTFRYLVLTECGIEAFKMFLFQRAAWGLFALIILDVILTGKRTELAKTNRKCVLLLVLAGACMLALNFDITIRILFGFIALFLTPISKERWIHLLDRISIAFYLAFARIMTSSFLKIPYSVKEAKYQGIFHDSGVVALFCACAFICSLYWGIRVWKYSQKKWQGLLVGGIGMLYPGIAIILLASRATELGLLFAIAYLLVFFIGKTDRTSIIRKFVRISAVIIVLAIAFFTLLYWARCWDKGGINDIENAFIRNKLHLLAGWGDFFWGGRQHWTPESAGPVFSAIDGLSSGRLTIAAQAWKKIGFWGSSDVFIMLEKPMFHPHNTYLTWLIWYGWVGGSVVIVAFISYVITAAKRAIHRMELLLPALLGVFLITTMLTTTVVWNAPTPFLMLFSLYPLLIAQKDDTENQEVPLLFKR